MKIPTNSIPKMSQMLSYKSDTLKGKSHPSNQIKSAKNFDDIIIHANQNADEDVFSRDLKNKIFSEVKSSISDYKLNDIKSQIALGEYQINSDEIVKRMLLL